MKTIPPTSAHPYFVIHRKMGKLSVSKFDSPKEAQTFINQHAEDHIYEILALFNFNTRTFLEDGLPNDLNRKQEARDYVDEQFPTEPMQAKRQRQNRESIRRVIGYNAKMFGIITLSIVLSYLANKYLNIHIDSTLGQCLAVLFYSGGTLGYLADWSVKTFGGKTSAEKLSQNILVWSYILGTIATVLALGVG